MTQQTANRLAWNLNHALQVLGVADPGVTHTALQQAQTESPLKVAQLLRQARSYPAVVRRSIQAADLDDAIAILALLTIGGATETELLNLAGDSLT